MAKNKLLKYIFVYCCVLISDPCCVFGTDKINGNNKNEYQLKAAFTTKFPNYIHWPESSNWEDTTKPFIIGIMGTIPYQDSFIETITKSKINNKTIVVYRINTLEEIAGCHLLYICGSKSDALLRILSFAHSHSVLTIDDDPGTASQGACISFFIDENYVRFDLNMSSFHEARLDVDLQLLRLALRVYYDRQIEN